VYTDGTIRYGLSAIAESEPQSIEDALRDSNWQQAMHDEYMALLRTRHGTLFPLVQGGILLIASGFTRLKENQMDPLIGIKHDLLLKVSSRDMVLIMRIHLVQL